MGSADFKSVGGHPAVSIVGSTPMRSRQKSSQHPPVSDAAGNFLVVEIFHQRQRVFAAGLQQVAHLGDGDLFMGFDMFDDSL